MGTSLDTGQRPSGPPGAKLRNVGDYMNFAVVDIDNEVPKYKFGTKEQEFKADGKTPKFAVRLTVMVLGGNAVRVENDVDVPLTEGEIASIFIDSYSKYDPDNDKVTDADGHISWGGAIDRDLGGNLEVGATGQWAFLRTIKSTQAGNNDRKDRKFKLRPADPAATELNAKCEQARIELQDNPPATQLETAGAATGGGSSDFGDF